MTTTKPVLISETNLSYAWGRAFIELVDRPSASPAPLAITLTGFRRGEPEEDEAIRAEVDKALQARSRNSVAISGFVIFPYQPWVRRGRPPRGQFFTWCLEKLVPRLKARDSRNRRGLYFERMMQFEYGTANNPQAVNQLAHIIDLWHFCANQGRRPRQSALQASCFNPRTDHNRQPRLGFPCLQQVSFTYDDSNGLAVNAFYPTQYIFDRGYGNYLGLCHLGAFMAHELGLELVRFNCFVARAELGDVNKSEVQALADFVRSALPPQGAIA